MRVKCKKFYTKNREVTELGSHCNRLTVGKEYTVLSISIHGKDVHFQFEGDDGDLIMFDADQFEQVSQYIPSNWMLRFETCEDGSHYLDFAPEKWNKARYPSGNGFYEEIIKQNGPLENWRTYPPEMVSEVVKLYLQETEIIYREEEEYQKKQEKDKVSKFTLYDFDAKKKGTS